MIRVNLIHATPAARWDLAELGSIGRSQPFLELGLVFDLGYRADIRARLALRRACAARVLRRPRTGEIASALAARREASR